MNVPSLEASVCIYNVDKYKVKVVCSVVTKDVLHEHMVRRLNASFEIFGASIWDDV